MKIEISTSEVYGRTYYCVEPEPFTELWLVMERWVQETMGPSTTSIWRDDPAFERWYANNSKFWFREEQDRTLFILRWS